MTVIRQILVFECRLDYNDFFEQCYKIILNSICLLIALIPVSQICFLNSASVYMYLKYNKCKP